MTDRHKGYVVRLAQDIRADDAEQVIAAIAMIKGVVVVTPVVADLVADFITEERRDDHWRAVLAAAISEASGVHRAAAREPRP